MDENLNGFIYWGEISSLQIMALQVINGLINLFPRLVIFSPSDFGSPSPLLTKLCFFLVGPLLCGEVKQLPCGKKNVGPVYQQQLRFKGYDTAMHHTLKAGDLERFPQGLWLG